MHISGEGLVGTHTLACVARADGLLFRPAAVTPATRGALKEVFNMMKTSSLLHTVRFQRFPTPR
jgi:hypothetical protein